MLSANSRASLGATKSPFIPSVINSSKAPTLDAIIGFP